MTFECEHEVTRDTSSLIEETGYWSGDSVLFNTDKNKIVILDGALTISDVEVMMHDYIRAYGAEELGKYIYIKYKSKKKKFSEFISGTSFRHIIYINKVSSLDRPECRDHGYISWKKTGEWLEENSSDDVSLCDAFANIIITEAIINPDCINWSHSSVPLLNFANPYIKGSFEAWRKDGRTLDDVLLFLSVGGFQIILEKYKHTNNSIKALNMLRESGAAVPEISVETDKALALVLKKIGLGFGQVLGLLAAKRKILLPYDVEPISLVNGYREYDAWLHYANQFDLRRDRRSIINRIIISSTIRTLNDVPVNIRNMYVRTASSSLLNSALNPILTKYAKDNSLPSFPLQKLHGRKGARNTKPAIYTIEWMRDNKIPSEWIQFFEYLYSASDAGNATQRSQSRNTLGWAWFKRGFVVPRDIATTDLRDPHHPDRDDTLYSYIKNMDAIKKWEIWTSVERAFRLVHNMVIVGTANNKILSTNPFLGLENPFKNISANSTHRNRLPTNVHEAMIQLLLSPDECGNPTFSFVKDVLEWDWFTWKNIKTQEEEIIWCPSRAHLLAFLLMMPVRSKQARWLDEGLLDQNIWDLDTGKYVRNTHPLKNWVYPSGNTHLEVYGRPSGALQPIHDSFYNREQLCIFVNTNKTQMWDKSRLTGYELWWPYGQELRECDITELTKQSDYLRRPYDILMAQRKWLSIHDNNPEPVSFADTPEDTKSINSEMEYPYFTPLFRDVTSDYYRDDGVLFHAPVPKNKIDRLFNALAYYTEKKLIEQGIDITITEPSTAQNSHKKRKCLIDLHSLRVYGVSHLVELGIPFYIVQMIVGHATPNMTFYYSKPEAELVRQLITEKIISSDLLGDWDDIVENITSNKRHFIRTNHAYRENGTPDDLLDADYTGFVSVPGGFCPLGGNACHIGQRYDFEKAANGSVKSAYGPVKGGCGNCRFFCTSPAHLFDQQMVVNELFIKIRSLGKEQTTIAEKLNELTWDYDFKNAKQEIFSLQSRMECIERDLEPLVLEWYNRAEMVQETIVNLDEYIEFVKENKQSGSTLTLLSSSSAEDLASHLEFRLEKTGEFELVRQTLRAAHIQGGVEKCSELSRMTMRETMDRIMIHEDPRCMLVGIHDEKVRDKVAFLMAEMMASLAGVQAVQNALDNNTRLQFENEQLHQEFKALVRGITKSANKQGKSSSLESLLPPRFQIINSNKETSK